MKTIVMVFAFALVGCAQHVVSDGECPVPIPNPPHQEIHIGAARVALAEADAYCAEIGGELAGIEWIQETMDEMAEIGLDETAWFKTTAVRDDQVLGYVLFHTYPQSTTLLESKHFPVCLFTSY